MKKYLVMALALGSSSAFATGGAAIDTSAATGAISQGVTAAGVIGGGFLAFHIGIAVWKKIRGAA
ncbi:hypothetical protein DI392_08155 [Vibrio albus]|uniref:Phage coat protein n=1 Tax=Vibrio albus TaxID=2200953 RepID=A0A2U3BBI5_9VIBR|nr:major capsid protein [Vibrio albus]PWI34150.1 hypothetical protein DI392_08155 [Vibrio albus]